MIGNIATSLQWCILRNRPFPQFWESGFDKISLPLVDPPSTHPIAPTYAGATYFPPAGLFRARIFFRQKLVVAGSLKIRTLFFLIDWMRRVVVAGVCVGGPDYVLQSLC